MLNKFPLGKVSHTCPKETNFSNENKSCDYREKNSKQKISFVCLKNIFLTLLGKSQSPSFQMCFEYGSAIFICLQINKSANQKNQSVFICKAVLVFRNLCFCLYSASLCFSSSGRFLYRSPPFCHIAFIFLMLKKQASTNKSCCKPTLLNTC